MKATASVILYKSKTLANDEHPIMLRICYNGKRPYGYCRVCVYSMLQYVCFR